MKRLLSFFATVVSAVLVLSACGSSANDVGGESTEVTDVASQDADGEGQASDSTTATTVEAAAPETTEAVAGASVVRLTGGPSEPWELPAVCEWNPENTGAASIVFSIKDTDEELTQDVDIFEVWPVTIEDDSETTLFGFVTNPDGVMLVLFEADASSDGETITVIANAHEGFKTFDDPPDHTLTITCGP